MQPEDVARTINIAYEGAGELSFCYGQGSVFTGLATDSDSDLDIVMVWDGEVPAAGRRPAGAVSEPGSTPDQFDLARGGLDKMRVGGWPVDIAHHPRCAYVTWFAARRRYRPQPKRIDQWVRRFRLDGGIADLDGRIWRAGALTDRHAVLASMVDAVLEVAVRGFGDV